MSERDRETQSVDLGEGYTAGHRRMELLGIISFAILVPVLGVAIHTVATTSSLDHASWLVAGAALTGIVGADFLSGLVHWGADNYGSENTPLVGEAFIRPFRHHHVAPTEMAEHDFIETNGNSSLTALPGLALASALLHLLSPALGVFLATFLLSVAVLIMCTNLIHSWVHMDEPPILARLLQGMHLILRPENHQLHHNSPHDCHYCITTGWLNPLLRYARFYVGAEWFISVICGRRPAHSESSSQSVEARRPSPR